MVKMPDYHRRATAGLMAGSLYGSAGYVQRMRGFDDRAPSTDFYQKDGQGSERTGRYRSSSESTPYNAPRREPRASSCQAQANEEIANPGGAGCVIFPMVT